MALPSSSPWSILDLNATNMAQALLLNPSDATFTPGLSFSTPDTQTLVIASDSGAPAVFNFLTGIPSRFTLDLLLQAPRLPYDAADIRDHRITFEIGDDASRGVALHVSASGIAVSRLDDFGSVALLPDTGPDAQEVSLQYTTLRVAVDGALGRAYVFVGDGDTERPALRFILPAEPAAVPGGDRLRITVLGTGDQPAQLRLKRIRVAPDVIMANPPPTADAGPDRVAVLGSAVRFDGRASTDPEGAPLSYAWKLIDAPYGSAYVAEIGSGTTIDDGDADGVTPLLSFAPGILPAWVAPGDVLSIAGQRFVIVTVNNGLGQLTTVDDIPDNLTAVPFRILDQSFLVGATTDTPYGIPDVQGLYRVELVVNDGESDSEPVEALANIAASRAPYGVEPDVSVLWKALGDEWKYVDGREVFEEAWRGAAQILAGKMLEVWQYHYNFSIRDAQRVLQRKWVPYRTLVAETAPDDVKILPRYGAHLASYDFVFGTPATSGTVLDVLYASAGDFDETTVVSIALTQTSPQGIVAELNAALLPLGMEAYYFGELTADPDYRSVTTGVVPASGYTTLVTLPLPLPPWAGPGCVVAFNGERYDVAVANLVTGVVTLTTPVLGPLPVQPLALYAVAHIGIRGERAFQIAPSSAAAVLGFETGTWNYLRGNGALATAQSYVVYGTDLNAAGVAPGDIFVINNGQVLVIDRVLTDPLDPLPGGRLLLREDLPFDATTTWDIPSQVVSSTDYELRGAYPGDLVKFEAYDSVLSKFYDAKGYVVGVAPGRVAARLDGLFSVLLDSATFTPRFIGVKRRKAVEIYADTVSIPRLQDVIPVSASPTIWRENEHYVLEPFYRADGYPTPMLQFRDEVFIDPDIEPADILWAEVTLFDNDPQIEALFGSLVGFTRDDASKFEPGFNYLAGVSGLLYSRQKGPHVAALRIGAQILFGQPFAEVEGTITEIDPYFAPTRGRILIQDATPVQSEVIRSYFYKKDPLDLTATSGLDTNPATGLPWAAGDLVPQFSPLATGVSIIDLYNDPEWYIPYVRSGQLTELEKFHTFAVKYNVDLVSLANLSLLVSFVNRASPEHTHPMLIGLKGNDDDVDPQDTLGMVVHLGMVDSTDDSARAFIHDDYRGNGDVWSHFDDSITYYDGIVDCPTDLIEFLLSITWPGGPIIYDSVFFYDTDIVDVGGTMGPPGGMIPVTYDLSLPAGVYQVTVAVKSGGLVLP